MSLGLHLVVLEVTGRCNLSCNYCYRSESAKLDLEDPSLLLGQLSEIRPHFITVSGGEPLLLKNVFALAKELKQVCKKLFLTTNGILVKEFPKSYFQVFDNVQISLDGDEKIHDSLRGEGSFEKVIDAAKYLTGIVPVSLLCTISQANYHQIEAISQIARDVGALPTIGRMCGFGRGNPVPLQEPLFFKQVLEDAACYAVLNDDPLNFWFNEKKKSLSKQDKIMGGCTAGIAELAISPEMDVFPCVKLRISAGNLKDQSLKNIWQSSPLFAGLRNWNNLKGSCPRCEYVSICRGCRADAWARTGDYMAADPLCWVNDGDHR